MTRSILYQLLIAASFVSQCPSQARVVNTSPSDSSIVPSPDSSVVPSSGSSVASASHGSVVPSSGSSVASASHGSVVPSSGSSVASASHGSVAPSASSSSLGPLPLVQSAILAQLSTIIAPRDTERFCVDDDYTQALNNISIADAFCRLWLNMADKTATTTFSPVQTIIQATGTQFRVVEKTVQTTTTTTVTGLAKRDDAVDNNPAAALNREAGAEMIRQALSTTTSGFNHALSSACRCRDLGPNVVATTTETAPSKTTTVFGFDKGKKVKLTKTFFDIITSTVTKLPASDDASPYGASSSLLAAISAAATSSTSVDTCTTSSTLAVVASQKPYQGGAPTSSSAVYLPVSAVQVSSSKQKPYQGVSLPVSAVQVSSSTQKPYQGASLPDSAVQVSSSTQSAYYGGGPTESAYPTSNHTSYYSAHSRTSLSRANYHTSIAHTSKCSSSSSKPAYASPSHTSACNASSSYYRIASSSRLSRVHSSVSISNLPRSGSAYKVSSSPVVSPINQSLSSKVKRSSSLSSTCTSTLSSTCTSSLSSTCTSTLSSTCTSSLSSTCSDSSTLSMSSAVMTASAIQVSSASASVTTTTVTVLDCSACSISASAAYGSLPIQTAAGKAPRAIQESDTNAQIVKACLNKGSVISDRRLNTGSSLPEGWRMNSTSDEIRFVATTSTDQATTLEAQFGRVLSKQSGAELTMSQSVTMCPNSAYELSVKARQGRKQGSCSVVGNIGNKQIFSQQPGTSFAIHTAHYMVGDTPEAASSELMMKVVCTGQLGRHGVNSLDLDEITLVRIN